MFISRFSIWKKIKTIIDLNKKIIIKDIWTETGHPNQNFVEALGVKPLKNTVEAIMNRTGIEKKFWSWLYKYITDINNICATLILEWKNLYTVRHGRIKDISVYLQFSLNKKMYIKTNKQTPNSKEIVSTWLGVNKNMSDTLIYNIILETIKSVV